LEQKCWNPWWRLGIMTSETPWAAAISTGLSTLPARAGAASAPAARDGVSGRLGFRLRLKWKPKMRLQNHPQASKD
jgi:hypothetical protein